MELFFQLVKGEGWLLTWSGEAEEKPPFLLDFIVSEKVGEGGVGEYSSASLKDVLKKTYMEKSKFCAYSKRRKEKTSNF